MFIDVYIYNTTVYGKQKSKETKMSEEKMSEGRKMCQAFGLSGLLVFQPNCQRNLLAMASNLLAMASHLL